MTLEVTSAASDEYIVMLQFPQGGYTALMAFVCLSVCLSICLSVCPSVVPNHKSKTEEHSKLKIGEKEAQVTNDPI